MQLSPRLWLGIQQKQHRRTCPMDVLKTRVKLVILHRRGKIFPVRQRKLLPAPRFYAHLADGNPTIMIRNPLVTSGCDPNLGSLIAVTFSSFFFLQNDDPFGWSQKSHRMVPQLVLTVTSLLVFRLRASMCGNAVLVWQRCDDPNPETWVPLTQTQNESDEIHQGNSPTCCNWWRLGGAPPGCPLQVGQTNSKELPLKRGTATQGTESSSYLKRGIEVPNT